MKTLILILTLTVSIVGCGSKRNNSSSAVGRNTTLPENVKQSAESIGSQWGYIAATLNPSQYQQNADLQKQFQTAVAGLMQSTLAPQFIGEVSGDPSNLSTAKTGVRFYGSVSIANGVIQTAGSILRLSVYDSFVGQKDDKGGIIPEYPLYFESMRQPTLQVVNGVQIAKLVFENQFTVITLEGQKLNGLFVGHIAYENKVNYDGGATWKSKPYMGQFSVSYCGFFKGATGCPAP